MTKRWVKGVLLAWALYYLTAGFPPGPQAYFPTYEDCMAMAKRMPKEARAYCAQVSR